MRKILIVEDERELRQILAETVSELGFEAYGVGDGIEALRLLEEGAFHLVLSDFQMPGMTGIELLAALKKRKIHLPFIILSAHGEKERIKEASELGAFDFLEKPFSLTVLSDVIERAFSL